MWSEEPDVTKIIERYQFTKGMWIGESKITKFLFDT